MSLEVGERVARLEQIVHNYEGKISSESNRIDKLESYNETLIRLVTLIELQTSINEETKDQMKSFDKTLEKVNNNLTKLNSTSNQTREELIGVNVRVKAIEDSNDNNKIDPSNLTKQIIVGIILLSVTLFGSFLAVKMGLK